MAVEVHTDWLVCAHRGEADLLKSLGPWVRCACAWEAYGKPHWISPDTNWALLWTGSPQRWRGLEAILLARVRVVVFGAAGALSPSLRLGDVVLATEVWDWTDADRGLRYVVHPIDGPDAVRGIVWAPVVTVAEIARTPRQKRQLYRETGAWVVDMESARWLLQRHRLGMDTPVAVIRWVMDTATERVPDRLDWWRQRHEVIRQQHADRILRVFRSLLWGGYRT